jgi:hypothetical protein
MLKKDALSFTNLKSMHDKTKALAVVSDNLSRNSLEKNILLTKIAIKITMMIDAQITVFLDICIYMT